MVDVVGRSDVDVEVLEEEELELVVVDSGSVVDVDDVVVVVDVVVDELVLDGLCPWSGFEFA